MWVWLWGFVSITIISLLSLLGVVLVPFLKQSCFKFLLTFLVALAVGTLSGDALLHLLPHVSLARPAQPLLDFFRYWSLRVSSVIEAFVVGGVLICSHPLLRLFSPYRPFP